jgi:hypothetical protein
MGLFDGKNQRSKIGTPTKAGATKPGATKPGATRPGKKATEPGK